MNLPDQAVQEFKQIYKNKCGVCLTDGEAKLKAENFLNLMKLITTPTSKQHTEDEKSDNF